MNEGLVATINEARALEVLAAVRCPDWTRHNEDRPGHLTPKELCVLADMIGNDDVCRQVLRGERSIEIILKNPTCGTILKDSLGEELLKEVGDLTELPLVKHFTVRGEFERIAFVCGLAAEDFLDVEENDVPAVVLRRRVMLKRSTYEPIFSALGGKIEKIRVAAAHVCLFLKNGDDTPERIFFVTGKSGNPLSVHTWYDAGLHAEILPVSYERELEREDIVVAP